MPMSNGSWVTESGSAGPGLALLADVPQLTRGLVPELTPEVVPELTPEVVPQLTPEVVPQLTPGVEQLGPYQGSGLTGATYLVRNAHGQVVQVSRLLNQVLTGIDGRSTISEIAVRVTMASGRPVSAGNVEYLLANKLAPLDLLMAGHGASDHAADKPAPAVLGLKLRRTLVSEAGVQCLARLFRPLFTPAVVVTALYTLLASDTWLLRSGRLGPAFQLVLLKPPLLLLVIGLSILSMLFHECGHAAACRYGGARPGVIGVGFYVIWPAFFTNVTDSYRLSRAGRIRTDLGGVYFNAVFVLMLMTAYLVTGYMPLLPAVFLIHLEIIQQLLPSLRLDGYFILADMIGVPDLFRRIGPTMRSMIPGQPGDPRVQDLARAPRVILTAWVLLVVPLLGLELTLIIVDAPALVRTFAHSLDAQGKDLIAQFGRADVPAALLSAFSMLMLVLPMAGLSYILLVTARRALRFFVVVNRRHPALRLPSVAIVLVLATVLAGQWGLLPPIGGHAAAPHPAAVGQVTRQRPAPAPAQPRPRRPGPETGRRSPVLTPVSADDFDPLGALGGDSSGENSDLARYAIDGDLQTAWQTQYYLGNPVFGGLKTGSGLILDMGRQIRLSSVTAIFGSAPGADVAIEVGNNATLAVSTMSAFRTVATADGIGGTHYFRATGSVQGRYVLIWFTKLPPAGPDKFQAQIFNVIIRGTTIIRRSAK
jgi:putative peptide zinc metalloprotease protein